MYQNCCTKCGSTELHTAPKGNNTGLYCSDCGAWVKWLGKDELRAFEHTKEESQTQAADILNLFIPSKSYRCYELNINKVNSIDDCKKILKFLCSLTIKPLPEGCGYNGFEEVEEYFT